MDRVTKLGSEAVKSEIVNPTHSAWTYLTECII